MGNSMRKIAPGSPETGSSLRRQVSERSSRSERATKSKGSVKTHRRTQSVGGTEGSSALQVVGGMLDVEQPSCAPKFGDWAYRVATPGKTPVGNVVPTPRKPPLSPLDHNSEKGHWALEHRRGRGEGREEKVGGMRRESSSDRRGRQEDVERRVALEIQRRVEGEERARRPAASPAHVRRHSAGPWAEGGTQVAEMGSPRVWDGEKSRSSRVEHRSLRAAGRQSKADEVIKGQMAEGVLRRGGEVPREPPGRSEGQGEKGERRRRKGRGEPIRTERGEAWLLPYSTGPITARYYPSNLEIGRGNFGVVTVWQDVQLKARVATKTISKTKLTHTADYDDIRREIQVMRHLSGHRNVCQLHGVYEDTRDVHLVMELCPASGLSSQILQRKRFPEAEAAHIFAQVVEGVRHMHAQGVMHRDLKPENILLSAQTNAAEPRAVEVKLADFGLAVFLGPSETTSGIAGSPYYFAPEVVSGIRYDKMADIWSLGVILYVLLSGMLPFYGENDKEIFTQIRAGKVRFSSKYWKGVSGEARSLVLRLLALDPRCRPSPDEVLAHDWLRNLT